jgi:hypothetical protein
MGMREPEGHAAVRIVLAPDPPLMRLDDRTRDREPEAESLAPLS